MRGRGNNNNNNNNRKGPNPLSRNYESNGPDVKSAAMLNILQKNIRHWLAMHRRLAIVSWLKIIFSTQNITIASSWLPWRSRTFRISAKKTSTMTVVMKMKMKTVLFAASAPQPVNGSGPQPVIEGTPAEVVYGDQGSENRSENRSQPRDGRDQRRLGRGRRPQRERFNADDASEQPSVEAPVAAADEQPAPVSAPVVEKPVRAEKPAKVVVEEAAPVVEKAAPAAEAPVAASAEEEAPVRRTRRPGRPRRVAKDEGAGDTSVAETADSDA